MNPNFSVAKFARTLRSVFVIKAHQAGAGQSSIRWIPPADFAATRIKR
jgi:hypothetical protein